MRKEILTTIFVGSLLFFGIAGVAGASTIGTTGSWDGSFFLYAYTEVDPVAIGQTFRLNSGDDSTLNSVTFFMDDSSGGDHTWAIDFEFSIFEWATDRITGSSLYDSGTVTTQLQPDFETFTFDVGGIELNTDTDYVFFFSSANFSDAWSEWVCTSYLFGTCVSGYMAPGGGSGHVGLIDGDAYANGGTVFMLNVANPAMLSGSAWDQLSNDLAFTMELSPSAVPEPSTLLLLGSGLVGLGLIRRLRRGA